MTGGVRNRFSDGVRHAVIGEPMGNDSGLSFLAPEARDLDRRWLAYGWLDWRAGGTADGVGEVCLFGIFEALGVKGECGVKGTAAA